MGSGGGQVEQAPEQQGREFLHVRQAGAVLVVGPPLQDQRDGARWREMAPDSGAAGGSAGGSAG